ncbi:serine/threonine-protein kinase [Demequina sp. NBRC 110053]|uniref:serine/threonine-protein kinase n=1 Tax=Demequina sp. NBRC 110053 TaxID=1570342 RepID=UPI001184DFA7|nr:serine/threonine-protein kinase [Demequina sp. NBRC 110053]
MSISSGTTLGGRYVLTSLLAVGGMGEVWRGTDSELDRPVAVKVLKDGAAANETFLKRFRNEAKNAAGLAHENIAQVLDYGDQDGTAYLVMELVEGEPLSTIIERERTLAEDRLVRIMAGTARGLAAAHAAGVMHRDIKPGNLLIAEGDVVRITDFGVSRSTDQTTLTQTGMVMGTAQYLAPELALGKPATPASDLYALGIIAFESVNGKRPFTAATAVDIAIAHVNDPVPPLPGTVSPDLARLIGDLLEKNPKKRPRTAADLLARLDSLTLREPGATPPPPTAPSNDSPASASAPSDGARTRGRGGRTMPPSIAPREYRPRPDGPPRERSGRSVGQ